VTTGFYPQHHKRKEGRDGGREGGREGGTEKKFNLVVTIVYGYYAL
jgi:hypothetical protein